VVGVERRAVIDQPRRSLPDEEVGVAVGAIRIGRERVQPHDGGGERRADHLRGRRRREVEGAVEISQPHVDAVTRPKQVTDLRIGLAPSERLGNLDQRELGSRKVERGRERSDDELGNERFRPLAGTAKLDDEHPSIRIHHGGKRAAFAQRLEIPDRGERLERLHVVRDEGRTDLPRRILS
jgi:hypothetical protein